MSQIIKAFTGMFFLLLLVLLGNGIVVAQLESAVAREYKDAVIAEIENSNFNPLVMDACIRQAEAAGYQLKITVYQEGEPALELTTPSESALPPVFAPVKAAEVLVNYEYKIGFLNYSSWRSIRGYAI